MNRISKIHGDWKKKEREEERIKNFFLKKLFHSAQKLV